MNNVSKDHKRRAAFSMSVGSPDEGRAADMLPIGQRLYLIKEKAIYAVQLAHQIDPECTNPDLPHSNQKAYPIGNNSELVGRILMQAKYLFKSGSMLDNSVDRDKLLKEAFSFFDEVFQLDALLNELITEQNAALSAADGGIATGSAMSLPSIMGATARAKTFILKAEHSTQNLFRMCQQYANLKPGKTGWFDGFVKEISDRERLQIEETEQLEGIARFANFIRNCRHCVEHEKDTQRIDVLDFQLSPGGSIELPSIEVVHPHTPEPRIQLHQFMFDLVESLLRIFEELSSILAFFLRSKEWKDHVGVAAFAPEQRLHPFVKYYYVMSMNGDVHPIG